MQKSDIIIRSMKASDLPSVVRIEEESFTMPFSHSLFAKFLTHKGCRNVVVEMGGKVKGYAIISVVIDESELLNIAVDSKCRKGGVGRRLMQNILDELELKGVQKIFLEVRPSNAAARAFYSSFGFYQVGIRKGYYHDTGENALVLMKEIGS